ncbi:MAG TPA: peptidylprolyl isomerase [Xanthomonadaceae bacterium]|nr:peptidylprolyl isomerase [Xanthomonadaceae bacterium]
MPSPRLPASVLSASLLSAALLAACATVPPETIAAEPVVQPATTRTMQEILDASQPSDWRALDPDDTVYLELDAGRVVIELAPAFAPAHVANIRTLAQGHYWDGLSIYRSHDNFVVQFGDPTEDEAARKSIGEAKAHLPAEFDRPAAGLPFTVLPDVDGWAPQAGFSAGFPAARDLDEGRAWLAHCYGAVGAGRGMAADSSNGTELYVVTGQSPRQLDRNITLVGRVVDGIELLSALPRGSGPLGFQEDPADYVPIRSVRLAADVPVDERSNLQVLRTDTPLFMELVESRRNRRDDWYLRPAGHIDLCNVPVPTR